MTFGLKWRSRQHQTCKTEDHRRCRKGLIQKYPFDTSEAVTMDDTDGGRRFVYGDIAGDEMMLGVGNF